MSDPMAMTDEEFWLYQARRSAAEAYRSEGFDEFAKRVELGLEDGCSQVRLARFFIEPSSPPDAAFLAAWCEMGAAEGRWARI